MSRPYRMGDTSNTNGNPTCPQGYNQDAINSDEEILGPYWIQLLAGEELDDQNKILTRDNEGKKNVKSKKRSSDLIECKICGLVYMRKNSKAHKNSDEHIQAQKEKFGEDTCHICNHKYVKGYVKQHNKRTVHKRAKERLRKEKRKEREERKAEAEPFSIAADEKKIEKETYFVRPGVELPEQNQHYVNTLTVFLALRYSFSNGAKSFKISLNNNDWNRFGDIVIEVTNVDVAEIQAIQCKQIQNRNNITIQALGSEIGKFSIREQCEILKQARSNPNYDKTYFKLYTVSSIATDNNPHVSFDDALLASWKVEGYKKLWGGREIVVRPHKGKNLLNTTDDPDDICVFETTKSDEELDNDLSKFRVYMNQKKIAGLKYLIKMMIEDKFSGGIDISEDLVKYVGEYFKTDVTSKKNDYNCKMTKTDVVVKVTELLLGPFLGALEKSSDATEEESLKLWNDTVRKFDVVVINAQTDIQKKLYKVLNYVLKSETKYALNTSSKVTVEKNLIYNVALRSEFFDGYGYDSREASLQSIYLTLWKTGLIPLVLTAEDEKHLSLILKVINFLKSENISLSFIIVTSLRIDRGYFPEGLKVFLNLEDLETVDKGLLQDILKLEVEVLDFPLSLKEVVDCNLDFLERLAPDAVLNILLKDYSFKDVCVPLTEEIIDNTVVLDDVTVEKIKTYFQERDGVTGTKNLSYLVNVKGHPTCVEVPPQL